jgi:hypothetical protein
MMLIEKVFVKPAKSSTDSGDDVYAGSQRHIQSLEIGSVNKGNDVVNGDLFQ